MNRLRSMEIDLSWQPQPHAITRNTRLWFVWKREGMNSPHSCDLVWTPWPENAVTFESLITLDGLPLLVWLPNVMFGWMAPISCYWSWQFLAALKSSLIWISHVFNWRSRQFIRYPIQWSWIMAASGWPSNASESYLREMFEIQISEMNGKEVLSPNLSGFLVRSSALDAIRSSGSQTHVSMLWK